MTPRKRNGLVAILAILAVLVLFGGKVFGNEGGRRNTGNNGPATGQPRTTTTTAQVEAGEARQPASGTASSSSAATSGSSGAVATAGSGSSGSGGGSSDSDWVSRSNPDASRPNHNPASGSTPDDPQKGESCAVGTYPSGNGCTDKVEQAGGE